MSREFISSVSQLTQPTSSASTWKCPLCGLRSAQRTEADFVRHLEGLHKEQLDEQERGGSLEYWKNSLVAKAFNPAKPDDASGTSTTAAPVSQQPGASLNNVEGMGNLSLSNSVTMQSNPESVTPSNRGPGPQPEAGRQQAFRPRGGSRQSQPNRMRAANLRSADQAATDFAGHADKQRTVSRDSDDGAHNPLPHKSPATSASTRSPTQSPRQGATYRPITLPTDARWPTMYMQPDSRPISFEQLAKEVKSIYAGLTMVESKTINLDRSKQNQTDLKPEVWKAMISVHRALLNEHHDFFLASQHPAAGPQLHRLALKYNMPARMWKHGIHSLLELLRHGLPKSHEFMVQFIYIAYQMVCLLLETVPSFATTWIECLGDISRYRMAIEDEDPRDRDVWANTARYWYCKAADRIPHVGRLYHHLAILARPNALQQLYLYSRSLISVEPFQGSRDTMNQALLEPILESHPEYLQEVDITFIRVVAGVVHGSVHRGRHYARFLELLPLQIAKISSKFREQGVYIAVALIACLQNFGKPSYVTQLLSLGFLLSGPQPSADDEDARKQIDQEIEKLRMPIEDFDPEIFEYSCQFLHNIMNCILQEDLNLNVVPFLHVILSFVSVLVGISKRYEALLSEQHLMVIRMVLDAINWKHLAHFLNNLPNKEDVGLRWETEFDGGRGFVRPEKGMNPLPEDFLLWGIGYATMYFPDDFFGEASMDEERTIEMPSTVVMRTERLLFLNYNLALDGLMAYDASVQKFSKGSGVTGQRDTTSMMPSTVPGLSSMNEKPGPRTITPKNSVLVIDHGVLKQPDMIDYILQHDYRLIVPAPALSRLLQDAKVNDPKTTSDHYVASLIKAAVTNQRNIRIFDPRKGDVTSEALNNKDLQKNMVFDDEDGRATIGVAKRATEELAKEHGGMEGVSHFYRTEATESTLLVTESEEIEKEAKKMKLPAMLDKLFRRKVIDSAR